MVNKILKWCQVLSGGRRYTCPTKEIDGKLFFAFKKAWHPMEEYITEHTDELVEIGGKYPQGLLENVSAHMTSPSNNLALRKSINSS